MELLHKLIADDQWISALERIDNLLIQNENIDVLSLKAEILRKMNRFADSINVYQKLQSIDAENKAYQMQIDLMQSILRMEARDIFECTNLHLDPWME
jgi:tetratricopeptide (TPR) repeat protein